MTPATTIRRTTLRGVEENYSGLLAMFRDLDAKAQGIGAVLGLFLTGLLAFTDAIPTLGGGLDRLFLAGFVVGFAVSIGSVVTSLLLRDIPRPWSRVDSMWRHLRDDELSEDDIEAFEGDLIQAFNRSSATLAKTIEIKVRWVWIAQLGLLFAIVMLLLLMLHQTNFWEGP